MAESQHHDLRIVSLLLNSLVITRPWNSRNSHAPDRKPSWRSAGLHGAETVTSVIVMPRVGLGSGRGMGEGVGEVVGGRGGFGSGGVRKVWEKATPLA